MTELVNAKHQPDYRQLVWLASYPKSGNTWVRLFLDAYFLADLNINDVMTSVSDDRAGLYATGAQTRPECLPIELQHLTRPMALLRLVTNFNEANHGIPLYVKTHHANMLANGVEMLPFSLTRSTIFIVRDPRDVVSSFAKHMGCDIDQAIEWMDDKYKTLSSTAGCMSDFISSWDGHTLSYLNGDTHNIRTFRYEDMRADPVKEFTAILRHSGVDPEPLRVRQALKLVELDKLRDMEKIDGFMESSIHAKNEFFGKGEVGGWSDKLTPGQQHKIEKKFGRVMKRLGYLEKKVGTWH